MAWQHEVAEQQRQREGRTRKWIADFCGVSRDTVNRYLSGRRKPKRTFIKLYALALNCPAHILDPELGQAAQDSNRAVGT